MSDLNNLLNSAFDFYNQGNFEQAEALTRDVLNANPEEGDALYLLGLIAYCAGAIEPAENLLYQAVRLYPESMTYQLALGSVLQKKGNLDEALHYYEKFQDNPMSLAQMGFIYLQKNQDSFAESAFKRALELHPELSEAILGLAQIEMRQGLIDFAIEHLEKIAFNSADIWGYLAFLYRKKKQYEAALSAIDNAISITDTVDFELEKGLILEALNRNEEATQAYHQGIKLDPYRSDVWTNLGNTYRRLNNQNMAEDAYKRAIQQNLTEINAHHNLAVLLQSQGRITEALEHYRSVLSYDPKYLPSLYNLALLQKDMGEEVEALGLYFNILAQKGEFPDLGERIEETLKSLASRGKKEKKQAVRFAEGWVRNFPENTVAKRVISDLKKD